MMNVNGSQNRTPFSASTASAGAITQPAALKSMQATDTVHFAGKPEKLDPAKPKTSFPKKVWNITKKYAMPYAVFAAGSFVALAGVPFHLLPVLGNAAGLAVHTAGAAIAAGGIYWGYKKYKASGGY